MKPTPIGTRQPRNAPVENPREALEDQLFYVRRVLKLIDRHGAHPEIREAAEQTDYVTRVRLLDLDTGSWTRAISVKEARLRGRQPLAKVA